MQLPEGDHLSQVKLTGLTETSDRSSATTALKARSFCSFMESRKLQMQEQEVCPDPKNIMLFSGKRLRCLLL